MYSSYQTLVSFFGVLKNGNLQRSKNVKAGNCAENEERNIEPVIFPGMSHEKY